MSDVKKNLLSSNAFISLLAMGGMGIRSHRISNAGAELDQKMREMRDPEGDQKRLDAAAAKREKKRQKNIAIQERLNQRAANG